MQPGSHPLDELHLSSITVGQIMTQAAARTRACTAPHRDSASPPRRWRDLAEALDELGGTALPGDDAGRGGTGRRAVGRGPSRVDLVRTPRGRRGARRGRASWQVVRPDRHPLAHALRAGAAPLRGVGDGVLLCLPPSCDAQSQSASMLAAARAALARPAAPVPLRAWYRASAARRDWPRRCTSRHRPCRTTVVTLPLGAAAVGGARRGPGGDGRRRRGRDHRLQPRFTTTSRAPAGCRCCAPVTRPRPPDRATSRSALATSCWSPAAARASPPSARWRWRRQPARRSACSAGPTRTTDEELAANLAAGCGAGVTLPLRPRRRHVGGRGRRRRSPRSPPTLGPVTAVLHGAGPQRAGRAAPASTRTRSGGRWPRRSTAWRPCSPPCDPAALKLLVTFGSIIGRAGLRGEADYATANDWLTDLTRRVGEAHPHCRSVALEWSVWSGAGMGERLAVLESLTPGRHQADPRRRRHRDPAAAARQPADPTRSW